ncbi:MULTISPECIES: hypothetical protein [Haloarcula]|uniref:hypothetical protein n=1 Tax=Haloarcula TaxID=2237 RepID=UPI0023EA9B96|nr:hypothetical protein [Halomicroarcula sp. XH51]
MVGPSITDADRERFLLWLKFGFALLVGGSMAMVTVYGGAALPVVTGVFVGTTALGAVFAWIAIPDSVAGQPYDTRERGPKPGTRTRARREREATEAEPRRADGDGRERKN